MRRIAVLCGVLLVTCSGASAASLLVSKGPGPQDVTLSWTGGVAGYEVYRSSSPTALANPANQIGGTVNSSLVDVPPADPIDFYEVLGADNYPFFSEYAEGSLTNKALELKLTAAPEYNVPFELSTCSIRIYANGSSIPTATLALPSQALYEGEVFVVCNSSAGVALAPYCDLLAGSSVLGFTGDDALELLCGTGARDVIGQIGLDPGTQWGTAPTSTLDSTLRRRCSVSAGDAVGSDAFVPALEWIGFGLDTFNGLGDPACAP
jgi:uncharacterized protein